MSSFRLSKEADADVLHIARYLIAKFGVRQARVYKNGLNVCFKSLSENVNLAQSATELNPGLKRFTYKSHVVFFQPLDVGILIVRVLHQRMDFESHL